ncbi:MAG: hypothetical protein HFE59_01650 [Clostridiales bacterium]|nr:hypothetical protein [Clostridiales bacterium]
MRKLEKMIVFFLIIILVLLNMVLFSVFFVFSDEDIKKFVNFEDESVETAEQTEEYAVKREIIIDEYKGEFQVYQNDKLINSFFDFKEAVEYAAKYENASVKRYNGNFWLWDNTPQYNVYLDGKDDFTAFNSFAEAADFARDNEYADIYYRKNNKFVWNNHEELKNFTIRNVGHITQLPELKRGCEVTSLAMLLNFKGFNTDKMALASEIKKDTTPYNKINGKIYFGNPNNGFVGDIYDYSKKGLGVYHLPIFALASSYGGGDVLDLTGCEFEDLYYFINKNSPIWIITNTRYDELPEKNFENWITPDGEVRVTYNEHSVLVVGYDDKYVYINDPLSKYGYTKKEKTRFIKAWKQMGRQAVTIKK